MVVPAAPGVPASAAAAPASAGAGRSGLATAGTALGLALAAGAALVLHVHSVPPERRWAAVLPLVWATPALLGLLARRRPLLLVPAALLGAGLAVLSLSGVTLVLLVPAGLYVAAASRQPPTPWPGPARTAVLFALPLCGLAAFAAALFVHEDPVCWEQLRAAGGGTTYRTLPDGVCDGASGSGTATIGGPVISGGSTSDTVVAAEAGVSAALVAVTLAIGWVAAAPQRR